MYGFPMPLSTSHFVVKIDTIFLTNSPELAERKGVHYIKGKTTIEGAFTVKVATEYSYRKYTIKQILSPVDKDMKEIVDKNKFAQYYQTTIEVTNTSGAKAKVGCLLLYDTMIENNDACKMGSGKKKYNKSEKLVGPTIPGQIQVYKDTANPSATIGECRPIIKGKRPDEVYVGNWPLLNGAIWSVLDETGSDYTDSAILLKWREKETAPGAVMQFDAAYGIPANKVSQLKLLLNDPNLKTKTLTVYFDLGKADLDLNGDMAIQNLLGSTPNIVGVTLHGHSDAYGGSEGAMELSKKRIAVVKKYFDQWKIAVTPKPHGNFQSETSEEAVNKGNVRDRKVVIELFYK
jgi:outer membrane protein OmpA-like peptidoglycan-associated protein